VELKFKYTKSSIEESGNIVGHFTIFNLERGQGLTIGNALRRVLLSNLEGTAITAIKIPNVSHEFSSIKGVREDILEIILNIKQIILKTSQKSPIFGKIKVQGPGIITAKCLEFNSEIFIINPNQYIATVSTNTLVEFECIAEKGIGYKFEDENLKRYEDFLNVDAIFMPVIRVNYTINDTYISYDKTIESLNLEIITNGSITPEKALSQAAEKLISWFNILKKEKILKIDQIIEKKPIIKPKVILIEELQLSVRAYNCLKRSGINSVNELVQYSQEEIQDIKNFGKKSANQVFQALKTKFNIILPSLKS
jgi:DNA-directed RNA polymerase subunit alpha